MLIVRVGEKRSKEWCLVTSAVAVGTLALLVTLQCGANGQEWLVPEWQDAGQLALGESALGGNAVISKADARRVSGAPEERVTGGLGQLSNAELLELYVATYQQSLRTVVADRAAIVQQGRTLLQIGYTYSYDRNEDVVNSAHTVPELLVRYRLLRRLEMRVAWAGVVLDRLEDSARGESDWDTRLSDPSVGARLALWSQSTWIPRTSVTISSPLNIESDVNVAQRFDPLVGLGYSWKCGDSWLISGSSAAVWTREDDSRYLDFQQSLAVDYLLGQRWGVFMEWSALFPEGARVERLSHNLGPGASYGITRDLQCEAAVLFGLDVPSPDIIFQLLVSWRM